MIRSAGARLRSCPGGHDMPAAITSPGEDREQVAARVCPAEQQGGAVAAGHRGEGTFRGLFHFLRVMPCRANVGLAVLCPVELEHPVNA